MTKKAPHLLNGVRLILTLGAVLYLWPALPGATRLNGCYVGHPFAGLSDHPGSPGAFISRRFGKRYVYAPSLERLLELERIERSQLKPNGTPHLLTSEPTLYQYGAQKNILESGCGAIATDDTVTNLLRVGQTFSTLGPLRGLLFGLLACVAWTWPVIGRGFLALNRVLTTPVSMPRSTKR